MSFSSPRHSSFGLRSRTPTQGTGQVDPLARDTKALLFHEGNRTLLHGIETIAQGAAANDHFSELVPHVIVDLVHGRPPLEIGVHLRGRFLEYLTNSLVTKERLRGVLQRRS